MTRWTASDIAKANARVRKAKHPPRVTKADFDRLKAIQDDVQRIEREDKARRKRLRIRRDPQPVIAPINGVLWLGRHRYAWERRMWRCSCGTVLCGYNVVGSRGKLEEVWV